MLWVVVFARLGWRLRHPPPSPPESVVVAHGASPVPAILDGLLLLMPIIGIITFHARVFDFGIFQINPGIKQDRSIFHPTEDIHGYLAYVIFGVAALHALVALWHRFLLHDGVLGRMWPVKAVRG